MFWLELRRSILEWGGDFSLVAHARSTSPQSLAQHASEHGIPRERIVEECDRASVAFRAPREREIKSTRRGRRVAPVHARSRSTSE